MAQKPLEPALLAIERLVLNEEGTKIRFVYRGIPATNIDLDHRGPHQARQGRRLVRSGGSSDRTELAVVGGRGRDQDGETTSVGSRKNNGTSQQGQGQGQGQRPEARLKATARIKTRTSRSTSSASSRSSRMAVGKTGTVRFASISGSRMASKVQDKTRVKGRGRAVEVALCLFIGTLSPDGKSVVFAKNHNLFIGEVGKEDSAVALSTDGVEDYSFATGGFGRGAGGNGNGNGNGVDSQRDQRRDASSVRPQPQGPGGGDLVARLKGVFRHPVRRSRSEGSLRHQLAGRPPGRRLKNTSTRCPARKRVRRSELYVYNADDQGSHQAADQVEGRDVHGRSSGGRRPMTSASSAVTV